MDLLLGLLETVSPTRCGGCDLPGTLLCEACESALPRIEPSRACPVCGAPFGWLVCTECWQTEFAFEEARCLGTLERPLSRCVALFKDGGERRLGLVLGDLLADAVAPWRGWPDSVAAVPASSVAVRRRGFDHASLLAERVAARLLVPTLAALEQRVACLDQRTLGRARRRENVAETLVVRAGVSVPPRVLLVDDVLTTGATLDAAAGALLTGGAREVRVCALARAW